MKHSISLFLAGYFLAAPSVMIAAVIEGAQKPVLGHYERVALEPDGRRNDLIVKDVAIDDVLYGDRIIHAPIGLKGALPEGWELASVSPTGWVLIPIPNEFKPVLGRVSSIRVNLETLQRKTWTMENLHTWFMSRATLATDTKIGDWYIPSFTLVSSGAVTVLGQEMLRYEYTAESSSQKYNAARIIAPVGDKVIRLDFYAAPERFDDDLVVFEEFLASLEWMNSSQDGNELSPSTQSPQATENDNVIRPRRSIDHLSPLRQRALLRRWARMERWGMSE